MGQLKSVFTALDADGSGTVTAAELFAALQSMGSPLTESEAQELIAKYDTSGDGCLDVHELTAAWDELNYLELARAKAREASRSKLKPHLLLGLSLEAIEQHIAGLPEDAVEQCNNAIPKDEQGQPKYPINSDLNGYVNQFHIARASEEDGMAMCERLQKQGSPHVGEATVFVSWFLATRLETLVDALRELLRKTGLPSDTKFWVCDFVIRQDTRQLAAEDSDVKRLGDCVRAVGHTVLLMEPWNDPQPLRRAYCIKEVYFTQQGWAKFDVVMGSAQQVAFEAALVEDFGSIQAGLSTVDVRTAKCLKHEDTKAILSELDKVVGLVECNTLVIGLLREALVAQGRAALARLPEAERGTSTLIDRLATLLQDMGKLVEARPLFEEALQARRETLTFRHANTLISICNLGQLLQRMGKWEEARPLCDEALQARRETLGDRHPETLISINNMGGLLNVMGKLEEARPLYEEALQARRETLGDRHPATLASINNMGMLLENMRKLEEARPLLEEALQARRETLGDRHPDTLVSINNMGSLLNVMGKLEEARPLYEEALQARRETLGDRHPSTLRSIYNIGLLLKAMGKLGEARPLYEEDLKASRETLGDRHPDTLVSINNMGSLLNVMGKLEEARSLLEEALQGRRATLGDRHPKTLTSIYSLGVLLEDQGKIAEAIVLFTEELEGCVSLHGITHQETLDSANHLVKLLHSADQQDEAKALAAKYGVRDAKKTRRDNVPT